MFKEYLEPRIGEHKSFYERDFFYHLLPWAYIYENKNFCVTVNKDTRYFPIVITKNGSFQTTFKIRGRDLDSCTSYELLAITEMVNNSLKQLNEAWTIHMNAIRKKIRKYSEKEGITSIPIKILELERSEFFKSGHHYESEYYITLTWQTPEDRVSKVKEFLFTKDAEQESYNFFEEYLKYYNDELLKMFVLFSEVLQSCEILGIDDTISYYHSLTSDTYQKIKVPRFFYAGTGEDRKFVALGGDIPKELLDAIPRDKEGNLQVETEIAAIPIDSYITDCKLTGGVEPKVGKDFIRTISVLNFPGSSIPGILDRLNRVDIEYIWNSRYIMLDKIKARKELNTYFGLWYSARKSFKNLLGEMATQSETVNQNTSAVMKAFQVQREQELLENDERSLGYYTSTIIIKGKNKQEVEKQAQQVKTLITSLGFVAEIEDFYALDAYLGTMPGQIYFNDRKPPTNSVVFSHLIPLNSVWAGDSWNRHLDLPPLTYCQTTGNTPFRLNLNYTDIGHTVIIGGTGSGKSVLLAQIQASFLGYEKASSKVIAFDKGGSTRVLNKAFDGLFYDLGRDETIRFQPLRGVGTFEEKIKSVVEEKMLQLKKQLRRELTAEEKREIYEEAKKIESIRADQEKEWAQEFIEFLLEDNNVEINPEIKKFVWNALLAVASLTPEKRTMSSFVNFVGGQSRVIKDALEQYAGKGAYAKYFDGDSDFLIESRYTVFEMEKIAETKNAIVPALNYLFHKIEVDMIDKLRPTIITLDEAWLFLNNKKFEKRIESWLRVMRKNKVYVIIATQSTSDITESDIKNVILDNCPTRIYLPNPEAESEVQTEKYRLFNLNDREINIIARATPKRQYYFKSPLGSRLFEFAFSPLELAYLAASSGEDQKKCIDLQHLNNVDFNKAWLDYKGLHGEVIVTGIQHMMSTK